MSHDAPELSGLPMSRVLRGKYGRLFRSLPPFDPGESGKRSKSPEEAFEKIAGELRIDDGGKAGDNRTIPAAFTYLGQLIAHDLTFDPTSHQARVDDPEHLRNFRTPRMDLDCLYGRGPVVDPGLYVRTALSAEDEPLVGYLLAEGKARQIGDGKNVGEPDLPRAATEVIWSADPPNVWMNTMERVDLKKALRDKVKGKKSKKKLHAVLKDRGWVSTKKKRRPIPVYEERRVRYTADPRTLIPYESGAWIRLVDKSKLLAKKKGDDSSRLHDVPENESTTIGGDARIADPRNDDNVLVSQVHLALARFHNEVLRKLWSEQKGAAPYALFSEARRITSWHYQWIVVNHYLPKVVGRAELGRALSNLWNGRSLYQWKDQPYLPVEFSGGAFRFGHAMIRGSYDLNDTLQRRHRAPFAIHSRSGHKASDLRGGRQLPAQWTLQWDRFLDAGYPAGFQASRKIDTSLAAPLMDMEVRGRKASLAEFDLVRGGRLGLPSGQAIAQHLGAPVLASDAKGRKEDPLWLYVLREAEVAGGECLGVVGGTIVAEVLLGLLAGDPSSYLTRHRNWTPREEGLVDSDDFDMTDLVRFAKLPVSAEEHRTLMRSV